MNGNKFATGQIREKPVEVVIGVGLNSWLSSKVSQTLLLTYPDWTNTNTLATHPTLSRLSGPDLDLDLTDRVSVLNIPVGPPSMYPADLLYTLCTLPHTQDLHETYPVQTNTGPLADPLATASSKGPCEVDGS